MELKFIVSRTKTLLDGTIKHVEQKDYTNKARALSKGNVQFGNDLIDETLYGSTTLVYDTRGNIYFNKAWNREEFPLEDVTD